MTSQQTFELGDPDSRTRSLGLNVVYAKASRSEKFNRNNLFGNFKRMRALTYTASIPMIMSLFKDFDYEDFECVFGHSGILGRDVATLVGFQNIADEMLSKGFVGLSGISEERRRVIFDRAAAGTARFFVVKDAIAHAKIYLLEGDDSRRVIVGSANLSETAFSGRQAETLLVFDDDDMAWEHYTSQYDAVLESATSQLELREKPIPAERILLEETPLLKEAQSSSSGVTVYVPQEEKEEGEYSGHAVITKLERIVPIRRQSLSDIRPDRKSKGSVHITPTIAKQVTRIAATKDSDDVSTTYLSRNGKGFILNDKAFSLDADSCDMRGDVACWLEFFDNYNNGFTGDIGKLQMDYYTFMCWFYSSPLMCDLRNTAMRKGAFSFEQPMFAILYGQSNCGKSSLVETLMTSMFFHPRIVENQQFTSSNLRGLQASYKRFPIVFDDITRDRFGRHAPEIIKDETVQHDEYPCFALSMNAEARTFSPEIIKRCLMIYTQAALPGDNPAARRDLQRSIASIRDRLTTSLYRKYLSSMTNEMELMNDDQFQEVDVLYMSSSILCRLFQENMPEGKSLPRWCAPMNLQDYQKRAFERPRRVLTSLLHSDKRSKGRQPVTGEWTAVGNSVIVGIEPMSANRVKADIPDWILDDTASVSNQIVMDKETLEDFLGESLPGRGWRIWPWG